VVFGEDIAALLGLVIALIAILMTHVTGDPLWDALGTIGIGILLIVIAVFIAIEVKDLLIGQSVDPARLDQIRSWLDGRPEVDEVFNLITMQFGPDTMIAVKARMSPTGSEAGLIEAINSVENQLRQRFPGVAWIFFEPDNSD
jgi:divalent metal cation (Fe/Co/Zn/Cd) transporter